MSAPNAAPVTATNRDPFDLEYRMTELRGAQLVAGMIFHELIAGRDRDEGGADTIRTHLPAFADRWIIVLDTDQLDALVHAFYALEDAAKKTRETFYGRLEGGAP